jgi:peptide/nickel transport system permease protein
MNEAGTSHSESGRISEKAVLARKELQNVNSRRRGRLQRLRGDWIIVACILFLVLIGIAAIVPKAVAPYDPAQQSLLNRLKPPLTRTSDGFHVLGTDSHGRDILSRIIFGARISMLVGISSVLIAGSIGLVLGLISGYYLGIVDDLIGWLTNVQLSFPFILLAIVVVAVLGPGLRNLIIVLGVSSWVVYGRVVRGEVLVLREREFIESARVAGARDSRIFVRHILPNLLTPVIVIATFEVARIIIAEAALSFLGFGGGGNSVSWGTMIADGRQDLATSWWVATMPGIAIMLTVLAVNLLGDWVRDELDPRVVKSKGTSQ